MSSKKSGCGPIILLILLGLGVGGYYLYKDQITRYWAIFTKEAKQTQKEINKKISEIEKKL